MGSSKRTIELVAILVGGFLLLMPVAKDVAATTSATVLFGGDMMFDRTIRTGIETKGGDYIFSCIDNILKDADLVVANLEGPITANSSRSVNSLPGDGNNFTFTFPLLTAKILLDHHIHLVNLGNNHILNFGYAGVASTTQALHDTGVGYFGDPPNYSVAHERVNGIPFAFINYNEFGGTVALAVQQIAAARSASEIPIVYTHWGIEYATTSPERIHSLAHAFVDAGAELVIGSHPHVVEEHELYKGKYIYYSLGNLIFDQYWEDAVRHGLLVRVTFTPSGVQSVQELSVELKRDKRTCPVTPSN